jgi:hypothetical protein
MDHLKLNTNMFRSYFSQKTNSDTKHLSFFTTAGPKSISSLINESLVEVSGSLSRFTHPVSKLSFVQSYLYSYL